MLPHFIRPRSCMNVPCMWRVFLNWLSNPGCFLNTPLLDTTVIQCFRLPNRHSVGTGLCFGGNTNYVKIWSWMYLLINQVYPPLPHCVWAGTFRGTCLSAPGFVCFFHSIDLLLSCHIPWLPTCKCLLDVLRSLFFFQKHICSSQD